VEKTYKDRWTSQYLISSHGSINQERGLQFNLKENKIFLNTYTEIGDALTMRCGFKLSNWLTRNRDNRQMPAGCGLVHNRVSESNFFPDTTIWSDPNWEFTSGVLDISRVRSPQKVFTFEFGNLSMPLTRLLELIKLHTQEVHKKPKDFPIEVHCLFCLEPGH